MESFSNVMMTDPRYGIESDCECRGRGEAWRAECGRWQMVGHGPKLSRNMDAAIGIDRVRAAAHALSYGKTAIDEDIVARLSGLSYTTETTQAILYGDRRSFNVNARKPPKLAA